MCGFAGGGKAGARATYLDRAPAPELDLPCPYPGMRPFTEVDAARFFGRDVEVDRMVRGLRAWARFSAAGS